MLNWICWIHMEENTYLKPEKVKWLYFYDSFDSREHH